MMPRKYLCDRCGRSFDTRKGLFLTHERTAPLYKLAQSFIRCKEEQNNMRKKRGNFYGSKKKHSK